MDRFDDIKDHVVSVPYRPRSNGSASSMNLTDASANGKRLSFSSTVMQAIGNPDRVEIALFDGGIVVSGTLPGSSTPFAIRSSGRRSVIYAAHLVGAITQKYNLDMVSRTQVSFYGFEPVEVGGQPAVFIDIDRQHDAASDDDA